MSTRAWVLARAGRAGEGHLPPIAIPGLPPMPPRWPVPPPRRGALALPLPASLLLHGGALAAALLWMGRALPPAPVATSVEMVWEDSPAEHVTEEVAAPAPPSAPPAAPAPEDQPAPPPPPPPSPPAPRVAEAPPPVPPRPVQAPPLPAPPDRPPAPREPPPAPETAPAPPAFAFPPPPLAQLPQATDIAVAPPPPVAPAPPAPPEPAPVATEAFGDDLPLPPPPAPPLPPQRPAGARPSPLPPGPSSPPADPAPGAAAGIGRAEGVVVPPGQDPAFRNQGPPYPEGARLRGETGTVGLELAIGADGRVISAAIARPSGVLALDEAARRAALAWRFRPATLDGRPVPGTIRTSIHFRLN